MYRMKRDQECEADDEEEKISLGQRRFVDVTKFRGQLYVNIREYYKEENVLKPSKKGIALKVEEWRKLLDLQPRVEERLRDKK